MSCQMHLECSKPRQTLGNSLLRGRLQHGSRKSCPRAKATQLAWTTHTDHGSRQSITMRVTIKQHRSRQIRRLSSNGAAAAAVPATVPNLTGKKVVVVGAGPAGSTVAMFLAQRGAQVEVYERRPEPKEDGVDTGRAYIIIVIPRGRAALDKLGIQMPSEGHYVTLGTVRHSKEGKVSVSKEEGNVTFSRSGLAQYLIDQARQRYPDNITFHFSSVCEELNLEAKKAVFQMPGSEQGVEVGYDLLVGADGVASRVRAELQAKLPDLRVDISDSGREYKVYQNLRGDIEPEEFKGRVGATLHLWSSSDPFTTVTAHSNPDGSYTGTFSVRTGGFEELKSLQDYEALLRSKFKGLPEDWIPQIAQQAYSSPASSAGKRIRCSQLHAPGVVLLGDAAHAVTPVFGQGCNSALESCLVLDSTLEALGGDLEQLPAEFSANRTADAHALYELDRKAFSFFRRKGPFDPDFLQLLGHVLLGTILSKIVPFLYGSKPALLRLGSTIPYSQISAAVARDSTALACLVGGLLIGFLLKFVLGLAH